MRGAAYLFAEFDRLEILELDFFADDDSVTDKKRLKPDPAVRERLFKTTAQSRNLALRASHFPQVSARISPPILGSRFNLKTQKGLGVRAKQFEQLHVKLRKLGIKPLNHLLVPVQNMALKVLKDLQDPLC